MGTVIYQYICWYVQKVFIMTIITVLLPIRVRFISHKSTLMYFWCIITHSRCPGIIAKREEWGKGRREEIQRLRTRGCVYISVWLTAQTWIWLRGFVELSWQFLKLHKTHKTWQGRIPQDRHGHSNLLRHHRFQLNPDQTKPEECKTPQRGDGVKSYSGSVTCDCTFTFCVQHLYVTVLINTVTHKNKLYIYCDFS